MMGKHGRVQELIVLRFTHEQWDHLRSLVGKACHTGRGRETARRVDHALRLAFNDGRNAGHGTLTAGQKKGAEAGMCVECGRAHADFFYQEPDSGKIHAVCDLCWTSAPTLERQPDLSKRAAK